MFVPGILGPWELPFLLRIMAGYCYSTHSADVHPLRAGFTDAIAESSVLQKCTIPFWAGAWNRDPENLDLAPAQFRARL